jgi:YspA, cpYpsA-related SLOG family
VRLLICGSRSWTDETPIRAALERARPEVVIHGAARGADTLAGRIAAELGCRVLPFPADWSLGRAAGVLRNQRMLDEGRPNWVIAFADDLRASRGTRDMVERAVEDPAVERVYHYGAVGWRTVKAPGRRPNYDLSRREAVPV